MTIRMITNRRKFLKKAGKVSLGASLLAHAPLTFLMPKAQAEPTGVESGGDGEIRRLPKSLGSMRSGDLEGPLSLVDGTIPTDLAGHFFVIAPIPHSDGSPVLNGDGQIYRFDFTPDQAAHLKMAVLKTPCYYVDRTFKSGRYSFSNHGIPRMNLSLGTRNQVNTGFLNMGDRLFVTFDAGRPFEIDPLTLRLRTPVGRNDEWKSALPGIMSWLKTPLFPNVMTSAHPAYDENTGEFFTVNYGAIPTARFFDLIRWDGKGDLERWEIEIANGGGKARISQSAHQVAITEDFIILADTGFYVESKQVILDSDLSSAQCPDTVFFVIDRRNLVRGARRVLAQTFRIAGEMGHFVADYQNPEGWINLHCAHNSAWDPSEWLRKNDTEYFSGKQIRDELKGMVVGPTDLTPLGRYRIHGPSGTVDFGGSALLADPLLSWGTVFFTGTKTQMPMNQFKHLFWASTGFSAELFTDRIAALYESYEYRRVRFNDLPVKGTPANLVRLDVEQMRIEDAYVFPNGRFMSSPQWMPSLRGGPGYLACVVLSDEAVADRSTGDEVWVFKANDLKAGPVCRLGHPRLSLGFTLHTAWMDPISTAAPASYHVSLEAEYADILRDEYDFEMQEVFSGQIYPSFIKE